jgi:hypothetical protein
MSPDVLTERLPVARPKGRPKKPGGEGTQVRIDSDLAVKAKYLATGEGLSLTEYLSRVLRPVVEKEFRKAGRNLLEEEQK